MPKKIKVVSLMKQKNQKVWKEISQGWEKYFEIEHTIAVPSKLEEFKNKGVDILFLDSSSYKSFHVHNYGEFQASNTRFKYVAVKETPETTDFILLKRLADDMVYTEHQKLAAWKTIAILRRYWNSHSKSTTVIYKDIIADFIENQVSLNGKIVSLTSKEIKLLRYFLDNQGVYSKKDAIFKEVWKIDDKDTTRVVDQILFKLKKKIGEDYFTISRQKGIKFE